MADYLSFTDGIPISDAKSLDSEQELNVADLTLEEELEETQSREAVWPPT